MKKQFLVLWSAGVLSTVLALPYIFALQKEVIAKTSMPVPVIALVSVVQASVLLAIAVFFGLKLTRRINLQAFALLHSDVPRTEHIKRIIRLSVPIGVAVALAIRGADVFFLQRIPALAVTAERIPFWKALLVAPYGGIVEELLMRLFLLTLFAWLLGRISKSAEPTKSGAIMRTAIAATAVLFGIGHLPATATITELTPLVITRAILLNGIGGLAFGWLYWKKGLEYAIAAHFTTDIALHAVMIALLK